MNIFKYFFENNQSEKQLIQQLDESLWREDMWKTQYKHLDGLCSAQREELKKQKQRETELVEEIKQLKDLKEMQSNLLSRAVSALECQVGELDRDVRNSILPGDVVTVAGRIDGGAYRLQNYKVISVKSEGIYEVISDSPLTGLPRAQIADFSKHRKVVVFMP